MLAPTQVRYCRDVLEQELGVTDSRARKQNKKTRRRSTAHATGVGASGHSGERGAVGGCGDRDGPGMAQDVSPSERSGGRESSLAEPGAGLEHLTAIWNQYARAQVCLCQRPRAEGACFEAASACLEAGKCLFGNCYGALLSATPLCLCGSARPYSFARACFCVSAL